MSLNTRVEYASLRMVIDENYMKLQREMTHTLDLHRFPRKWNDLKNKKIKHQPR